MASTLPTPNDCCKLCEGQTVTIVTSDGGGGGTTTGGLFAVETLAALRAIPSSSTNQIAFLMGNTVKYDFSPAKEYYWDPSSVDADNPFSVVVPTDDTGSGRWIQVV